MSRFNTSGSGDIPVGGADGAVRIHIDDIDRCSHRDNNICPRCAGLTDEETDAVRQYLRLLAEERSPSCTCDRNPDTTDGPSIDCPVHGLSKSET